MAEDAPLKSPTESDADEPAAAQEPGQEDGDGIVSIAQVFSVRVAGVKQCWLPEVQCIENMNFVKLNKWDPVLCKLILGKSMNRHRRREMSNMNTEFWNNVFSLRCFICTCHVLLSHVLAKSEYVAIYIYVYQVPLFFAL